MPPKIDERYQDPVTGEIVSRVNIPAELLPTVEKLIMENSQLAAQFMQMSKKLCELQQLQMKFFNEANQKEDKINEEVVILRDKLSLDTSWIYNIALKKMEKREPPEDAQMIGETKT